MNFTNTSQRNFSSEDELNSTVPKQTGWKPSDQLKASLLALYALIFTFGVVGNLIVCYVLGTKKKPKRNFDILLVSLAITDLIALASGSITMIGDLIGDLTYWHFGSVLCKILPSCSPLTLFASSWTLAVIALERYRVIKQKRSKEVQVKIILFQLAIVWALAILATLPYIIGSKYEKSQCYTEVLWPGDKWVLYIGIWTIVGWGVPLLGIILLCFLTFRILSNSVSRGCHSSIAKRSIKRNKQILLMFIIIVCAFISLTTPYAVFYFSATYLLHMNPSSVDSSLLKQMNYALFMLMMINSSLNPIVYAKLHKEVRRCTERFWGRFLEQISRLMYRICNYKTEAFELSVLNQYVENGSSHL